MSPIDKNDPDIKNAIDEAQLEGAAFAFRWVQEVLDGKGPSSIHPAIDAAYQDVKRRIRDLQAK